MRKQNKTSKRVLRELASGIEDVINEFNWLGFHETNNVEGGNAAADPEGNEDRPNSDHSESHDDDEEEYSETEFDTEIQREDIEIGIDSFISHLIKKKLISKQRVGRRPTLSQVFSQFFDESHEIVTLAYSFEEHIKGYFGFVEYDEVKHAFSDIVRIRELLADALREAAA